MASSISGKPADFSVIWSRALRDFYGSTNVDLANDPDVFRPRSVDELIQHLNREHEDFGNDSRSSKFTQVMKGALGPLNFLTSTVGSTAAQMFPGGGQVLAAFGVLVNAGAAVTKSFDAVGGLFEKLGSFTGRLSEVSRETIPDALVPIYQAMLVSLLDICALATRMTFKSMMDANPGEHKLFSKVKRKLRPAFANVGEYMNQLLMGGNGEVNGAVGKLKTLVENESLMMEAIVVRKATHIEAVAVDIQGMTVQLTKATYDLQADTAEVKFRVTLIGQSLDRIESTQHEMATTGQSTYENTVEIKADAAKAQKQIMSHLEGIEKRLADYREKSGSSKQQEVIEKTKAAVHGESKAWKKLESSLGVTESRKANQGFFERIRAERIKGTTDWILEDETIRKWSEGEVPLVLVSGEAGFGKTFLASRVIDRIMESCKSSGSTSDRSVTYYFWQKGQNGGGDVCLALKTMAYELSQGVPVYAKYLSDLIEGWKLAEDDTVRAPAAEADALEVNTAEDAQATAGVKEDHEDAATDDKVLAEGTSALKLDDTQARSSADNIPEAEKPEQDANAELSDGHERKDDVSPEPPAATDEDAEDVFVKKLQRVNTAILERSSLEDTDEENAVGPVRRHWNKLFRDYFKSSTKHIYLVLDGLEECGETETIALCAALNASAQAQAQAGEQAHNIHTILFMNANKAQKLGPELLDRATIVPITNERNMADLERFVDRRMADAWSKKLIRKCLYRDVHDAVLSGCEGNFLKASLIVDEITSLPREDVIRSTIQNLPTTLEAAMLLVINRLSRQLDEHEQEDLHDILAWVVCAKRTLDVAEIDAIMTVRRPHGARIVDLDSRLRSAYVTLFTVTGDSLVHDVKAEDRVLRRLRALNVGSAYSSLPADENNLHAGHQDNRASIDEEDGTLRRAMLTMGRSNVSLSHSLIAEQLQERTAQAGITTFSTSSMQAMVLIRCLESICGINEPQEPQVVERANRYCGPYMSDHLVSLEVQDVDTSSRVRIGQLLIKVFREPDCAMSWVAFAAGNWIETDLLSKSAFRNRALQFLQDADVVQSLSSDDAQWVEEAARAPIKVLYAEVAKAVARRWLTQILANSEYYFSFLNRYDMLVHQSEQDENRLEGERDASLDAASIEDIIRIAEATGLPKNARWHGRIAVALRRVDKYDESVDYFHKAMELDNNDGFLQSGLALTLANMEEHEAAVPVLAEGIDLIKTAIAEGRPSADPFITLQSYLLDDQWDYAAWSLQLEKVDQALQAYQDIIQDLEHFDITTEEWGDMSSILVAYHQTLCDRKRWTDASRLLERLSTHPQRLQQPFYTLYQYMALNNNMLRIGYHTRRLDILTRFMENALNSFARHGMAYETPYAVYFQAMLLIRLEPSRVEEGIELLVAISEDDETLDVIKDLAERELARHYFSQALQARERDRWPEVGRYAERLVKLVVDDIDGEGKPIFGRRDCAHVLAAWDRLNGRMHRAKMCVRADVTFGIDLLDDTDPDNDDMAWMSLMDAFLPLGRTDLAVAAGAMPRQNRIPAAQVDQSGVEDVKCEADTIAGAEKIPDIEDGNVTTAPASVSDTQPKASSLDSTAGVAMVPKGTDGTANPDANKIDEGTKTVQPDDTPEASSQTQRTEEKPDFGGAFFSCDGCCFEEIPNDAGFWRCSYCIADFCNNCHELIMTSRMVGWNICGSSHEHVSLAGMSARYPDGIVKVDGEDKKMSDLVADLRSEWDYPKVDV